jgi:hypothetical protein
LSEPGGQAERIVIARDQARVRDPLFAVLGPIVIDVAGRSPAEIVEAALDRVRERLREQRPPG